MDGGANCIRAEGREERLAVKLEWRVEVDWYFVFHEESWVIVEVMKTSEKELLSESWGYKSTRKLVWGEVVLGTVLSDKVGFGVVDVWT